MHEFEAPLVRTTSVVAEVPPKLKDSILKYEHLNKVNLVGSFAIALSFVLTVMLSALDVPHKAVHTASVIVSISSLLWAGCAMFILLTHDPERELSSPVVDR